MLSRSRAPALLAACGLLAILGIPGGAGASSTRPLRLDDLVSRADLVVRGRIVDLRVEEDTRAEGRPIVTFVVIDAERTLKGTPRAQIVLRLLGGRLGEREMTIEGGPQFAIGDRALLCVREGRTVSPIVGLWQGRFPIARGPDGVDRVTLPDGRAFADIAEIGAPARVASAAPIQTLTLEQFELEVARALTRSGNAR